MNRLLDCDAWQMSPETLLDLLISALCKVSSLEADASMLDVNNKAFVQA
jgi:hypothetical protein